MRLWQIFQHHQHLSHKWRDQTNTIATFMHFDFKDERENAVFSVFQIRSRALENVSIPYKLWMFIHIR